MGLASWKTRFRASFDALLAGPVSRDPIAIFRSRACDLASAALAIFVLSCRTRQDSAPEAASSSTMSAGACSPSASPGATACGPETSKHTGAPRSGEELRSFCQKNCAAPSFDEKDVVHETHAKVGDLTRCPVSGVGFV